MSAVLESLDTGADLNAATDTGGATESNGSANESTSTAHSTQADQGGVSAGSAPGASELGKEGDLQSQPTSDGKDKLVPLSALHEARAELRALRTKIAELEAKPSLTPQQQAQLDKLNAQETAVTEKVPDFLEDPKGYVDATAKKTDEALKKLNEFTESQKQQQQQQQQLNQILSGVGQHEQAFLKTTPDYHAAVDHIRSVRGSQLKMLYPTATPDQIAQQITTEELAAASQILRAGGNPAEFAYNYAKTMGYAPKAPNTAATPPLNSAAPDKDAVRTLGNGGGADKADEPEDDELGGALKSALAERFGVRKRK